MTADPDLDDEGGAKGSPAFLIAASRLRYFTVSELAEHAGEQRAAAESFLRRCPYVERTNETTSPRALRRGPREKRWQVRLDKREDLARSVSRFARLVDPPRGEALPMESAPSLLDLLRSSVAALNSPEMDEDARSRNLARARRYLAGARADRTERAAKGEIVLDADATIAEAEQAIERIEAPAIVVAQPRIVVDAGLQQQFATFLANWLVADPPSLSAAEEEVAARRLGASSAVDLLDELLHAASTGPGLARAVAPAAELLHLRRGFHWSATWPQHMGNAVVQKALRLGTTPSADLAPLMIIAATLNTRHAADELARAFLALPHDQLDPPTRRLCLFALARLARPLPTRERREAEMAAAASYSVFTLGQFPNQALPALAPAILCAPMVDTASVLLEVGQVLFGEARGGECFPPWADETIMLGNITLALCRDGFNAFGRHFGTLVGSPQAKELLFSLKSKGMLNWKAGHAEGEADLTIGDPVFAALDGARPLMHTIRGLDPGAFTALNGLLQEFRYQTPDSPEMKVVDGSLMARIAQRKLRAGM